MNKILLWQDLEPLQKAANFQLACKHLILDPAQKEVVRVVVLEDLKKQVGGSQQVALFDSGPWKNLEDETFDGGHISEFSAHKLRGIEPGAQVIHEVGR